MFAEKFTSCTTLLLILSMFLILPMLSGCPEGGNGEDQSDVSPTAAEQIAALERDGKLPVLDRSSDVKGPDSNSNGIRDDVDTFIAGTYSDSLQRAAVQQFAAVIQEAMLIDKTNATEVKAVSTRSSRAVNCIYSRFDGSSSNRQPATVIQEISSMTTNTKARLLAYLAYSKALDGTATSLPEGNTCE